MAETGKPVAKKPDSGIESRSGASEIAAFVDAARKAPSEPRGGRLILSLDATMSRQPTWDLAVSLQSRMFDAVGAAGGLSVQLAYFRGYGECRASGFVSDTRALKDLMVRIDCRAGRTQIGKVLGHVLKENAARKVAAVVYIGDAFEEAIDEVAHKAGEMGVRNVPLFVFQEGRDGAAQRAFREFARLSGGAWFPFDRSAPDALAKLLASVAVYATGGRPALEKRGRSEDIKLLSQMGR